MNSKERVLALIAGKPTDRLAFMPITMMYAADVIGRNYHDYATDCRVMAEAQIRTAEVFDIDHVSGISDPAREAADCGAIIFYPPDAPPAIDETQALLADTQTLAKLKQPDPLGGGRMHDRVKAVAIMAKRVGSQRIVEGWVEGPCAQGSDLRGINSLMLDFYDDPTFVRDLFEFVIDLEYRFAKAQVDAGASLIGIGDAAASLVGGEIYHEFVWPYEKRLVDAIRKLSVPVRLHICGTTTPLFAEMGKLGVEIIDLDYPVSIAAARSAMPPEPIILGNIDPVRTLRNGTVDSVYAAIAECHKQAGNRYIVGAGCEIPRGTRPELVHAMRRYAAATSGN